MARAANDAPIVPARHRTRGLLHVPLAARRCPTHALRRGLRRRWPRRAAVGALRFEMPRLSPQQAQSEVPASQVPALLAAVQKEDVIRLSTDSAQWQVSLHGAAALLKMDDLQGRVGTPGALVRQGTKPESSVPAPAVPGVKAARHVHQEALRPQCVEHRRSDDAHGRRRRTGSDAAVAGQVRQVFLIPPGDAVHTFQVGVAAGDHAADHGSVMVDVRVLMGLLELPVPRRRSAAERAAAQPGRLQPPSASSLACRGLVRRRCAACRRA
jgi:hypothetical protein